MLSPHLLTSSRQTHLLYPGVVGGCTDDERLMSVLSSLPVRGGQTLSDQRVAKKQGSGWGALKV